MFLNLVLEFVPETIYKACRHYARLKQPMPNIQIKVQYLLFKLPYEYGGDSYPLAVVYVSNV